MHKTTFLLSTMFLCAACAGPTASSNAATAGPAAAGQATATVEDAPLLKGPDIVCETVRPTGSNIAERTCRPRTPVNQTNQFFPIYTPAGLPPGGGG